MVDLCFLKESSDLDPAIIYDWLDLGEAGSSRRVSQGGGGQLPKQHRARQ